MLNFLCLNLHAACMQTSQRNLKCHGQEFWNVQETPHFETQKSTIWHLLKPASNVQEFTPLWDSKVYNLTFVEAFFKCARNHPTWKQQKVTCHFALVSVTCQCINQRQFQPIFILTGLCAEKTEYNLIAFNCIFSTSFLHAAVKLRIGENCIWWVWLCVPGPWLMPDPIWVSFLTYSGLPPLTICSISCWYFYQYKNSF